MRVSVPDDPAARLVTLPQEIPRLTLGWEAVRWASKYLRQPNGVRAGQRFEFVDSQIRFLLHWYAVHDDGSWVYYHGVRRLAKGSGKSPFAAVLSLIELCAPVRLKDFDPKLPGGCKGKPVSMPLVQIAATAETQTANTMRMVRAFAPKGSRVCVDHKLEFGRTRYNMIPEGGLEVITSSMESAEGAEATHITGDETEHWRPSNGGPEYMSTLLDNLTKSGNRLLETCNAWKPDVGTVAQDSFDTWVAQELGKSTNAQRVLYDARLAPPTTDMADDESLRLALEHVYDDCYWTPIPAVMTRIRAKNARVDDSKRKYLNWPTAPEDAWIRPEWWNSLADSTRVLVDKERVVLFFDGSKSNDATALIGCCMDDGFIFTVGVWEPDPNDDEDVVDVEAVDLAVQRVFDRFAVEAFFADVREWEQFSKLTWPQRYKDQLKIWAVPGGKSPEPIAWDMRSHSFDFELGSELVEAEIREGAEAMRAGREPAFRHDGHPRTAAHVKNARRFEGRHGLTVRKESPKSPDKIDACVCVIGARIVRKQLIAADKSKPRTGEAAFF